MKLSASLMLTLAADYSDVLNNCQHRNADLTGATAHGTKALIDRVKLLGGAQVMVLLSTKLDVTCARLGWSRLAPASSTDPTAEMQLYATEAETQAVAGTINSPPVNAGSDSEYSFSTDDGSDINSDIDIDNESCSPEMDTTDDPDHVGITGAAKARGGFVRRLINSTAALMGQAYLSIDRNFSTTVKQVLRQKMTLTPSFRRIGLRGLPRAVRSNPSLGLLPFCMSIQAKSLLSEQYVTYTDMDLEEFKLSSGEWPAAGEFWSQMKDDMPQLAEYAMMVLNIPMSSAEVERVFSIVSHVDSNPRREQLRPQLYLDDIKIRSNRNVVSNWAAAQASMLEQQNPMKPVVTQSPLVQAPLRFTKQ